MATCRPCACAHERLVVVALAPKTNCCARAPPLAACNKKTLAKTSIDRARLICGACCPSSSSVYASWHASRIVTHRFVTASHFAFDHLSLMQSLSLEQSTPGSVGVAHQCDSKPGYCCVGEQ